MLKFLSNAVLGVLVDKKARKKLEKRRQAKTRDGQIASIRENVDRVMTPERQELIRRAMELQRAKSQIFNSLNDEEKQKMVAQMIKGMLREGDKSGPGDNENS